MRALFRPAASPERRPVPQVPRCRGLPAVSRPVAVVLSVSLARCQRRLLGAYRPERWEWLARRFPGPQAQCRREQLAGCLLGPPAPSRWAPLVPKVVCPLVTRLGRQAHRQVPKAAYQPVLPAKVPRDPPGSRTGPRG